MGGRGVVVENVLTTVHIYCILVRFSLISEGVEGFYSGRTATLQKKMALTIFEQKKFILLKM